jgi:hypothetical protein
MMRLLSKKTDQLECHLTPEEFSLRSSSLAAACQDVAREMERQTQMKAAMKAELARLESERSRLVLIVSRRAELRDVMVRLEADDEKAEAVSVREDTGEIIRRRALEMHERQPNLPGVEPEEPAQSDSSAASGGEADDWGDDDATDDTEPVM